MNYQSYLDGRTTLSNCKFSSKSLWKFSIHTFQPANIAPRKRINILNESLMLMQILEFFFQNFGKLIFYGLKLASQSSTPKIYDNYSSFI